MLRAGVPFRLIKDHLGSVRVVVNAQTGIAAQLIDYDEFGNVTRDTTPGFQPFGFAGGLYDPDTSLVRFGARDYDASVGRWAAKDPIGFRGGTNLFAYCDNDPLNRTDPTGQVAPAVVAVCALGGCEAVAAAAVTAATYAAAAAATIWAGWEAHRWFAKKRDIQQVEDIIRRTGLDRAQRRRLHDEITRRGLDLEEIEQIAREIAEGARRARPHGGGNGGHE
jgi:RHS repeat-associated protein